MQHLLIQHNKNFFISFKKPSRIKRGGFFYFMAH